MTRAVVLLLALALTGCPGEPSGIAKGKVSPSPTPLDSVVVPPDAAPEAASPAPEASGGTALVALSRRATVRDARDGFLYLRSGPSSQFDPLAQMPNGTSVFVDACEPGTEGRRWCRTTFGGLNGWASETGLDYAQPDAPRETAAPRRATVQDPDGWTNLRAEASTTARVLIRLVAGTTVEVQVCIPPKNGSRSRWCEVDAFTTDGTLHGWIAESRLRYN